MLKIFLLLYLNMLHNKRVHSKFNNGTILSRQLYWLNNNSNNMKNEKFKLYGRVLANDLSAHNPYYNKSNNLQWNGNPGTEGLRIIPKITDITHKQIDADKIKTSNFGKTNNIEENNVIHKNNVFSAINNTTTNNLHQ